MSNNLLQAHYQWQNRPNDERFGNIADVITYLNERNARSHEREAVPFGNLSIGRANDSDIVLVGHNGHGARFTHHSIRQLSQLVGVPVDFVTGHAKRDGGIDDVAAVLNTALNDRVRRAAKSDSGLQSDSNILVEDMRKVGGDGFNIRAFTTAGYQRIWDLTLAQAFQRLQNDFGFSNPMMWEVRDGEGDAFGRMTGNKVPGGLFAGERNIFLIMENRAKAFDVNGQNFFPFLMGWNSEVGDASIGLTSGIVQEICGNLICWGARDVTTIKLRHVGNVSTRWTEGFLDMVNKFTAANTLADRDLLRAAMESYVVKRDAEGNVKPEAVVTFLHSFGLTKNDAKAVVKTVEESDPKTVGTVSQDPTLLFNLVAGMTFFSQREGNADDRFRLDSIAGKMLAKAAN